MFDLAYVTDAIRSMELDSVPKDLPYCQKLELKAKHLGFQNWNHLLNTLRHEPDPARLETCTMRLMKKVCGMRLPRRDKACVQFTVLPDGGIGHYSYWIGWDDDGDEVRVPRSIDGREQARKLRKLQSAPIFVIENERELLAWLFDWTSTAIMAPSLAKHFFPSSFSKNHLVSNDPPMDVIKAKYAANISAYEEDAEE